MIRPADWKLLGLPAARIGAPMREATETDAKMGYAPPKTSLPTPYERLAARNRRSRATAWTLFLLFIAAVFAARILLS